MEPTKQSTYTIQNTEEQDLDLIYLFFEKAIEYIQKKHFVGWTTYDKNFIIRDQKCKLQFKIVQNHRLVCVFSICFSDALIWREKEQGDAIYLHRIVVNPLFKGQQQFAKILKWVHDLATQHKLKYIRMDTWAENQNIIDYYKSFGFKHIENYTTPDTLELPVQHRNLKVALLQFAVIN
jgi:ribosomal protein S18 acetylase RimI-like enzyme